MKAHKFITAFLVLAVVMLAAIRWFDYRERAHHDHLLAELDAAHAVRNGIARYRSNALDKDELPLALDFTSFDSLIRQLSAAKCVEEAPARYLLAHRERFAIRKESAGLTIDARWIFDDSAL